LELITQSAISFVLRDALSASSAYATLSMGLLSFVATLVGAQPADNRGIHMHRVIPFAEYKDAGSRRFMLIFSLDIDGQKIANPDACLKIFILFLMIFRKVFQEEAGQMVKAIVRIRFFHLAL
jgi:hypothetical protein